jgi:hypothetical protein
MAPLLEHRMGPAPVFESTVVDLIGPIVFKIPLPKWQWQGLRCDFCLHSHISGTRGNHRRLLNRFLRASCKKVHGHPRSPNEVSVGPGHAAGGNSEADTRMRLVSSAAGGRNSWGRMAFGPHGSPAFQRPSR